NTQLGQLLEETAADSLGRAWQLLRDDLLIGLWNFIVWFFGYLTERLWALIYDVDERLRFREGDSAFSFVLKCVLGVFWFAISYVIRFIWLLFVEPQINPIKHFPVVTVGHKLSLLLLPMAAALLGDLTLAFVILGLIP